MILYSIKDVKAQCFGAPVPFTNDVVAKRAFCAACSNPESVPFPADLELWRIGELDDASGQFAPSLAFICVFEPIPARQAELSPEVQ